MRRAIGIGLMVVAVTLLLMSAVAGITPVEFCNVCGFQFEPSNQLSASFMLSYVIFGVTGCIMSLMPSRK